MRVLLDTTFALRGPSGTGVYLHRLAEALERIGVEVLEAQHEGRRAPAGGGLRSGLNLASDAHWTQVALPRRARASKADVLHHPLPALATAAPCPQVVTVHDLAFLRVPEDFDPQFRAWATRAHRRAARGASAVVAVSETTRRDVMSRWGVAAEQIVVARHGPGQEPAAVERDEHPSHFLYLGDDEPRKDLPALRRAHARYVEAGGTLGLVLAGCGHTAGAGVEVVERPGVRTLRELYAGAAALVSASRYEGFGLTPLEAMAAGVPVLAIRAPGTAEVCADAALYAATADELAAAMGRLATDAALRADLTERGRRRAAEFSWARSARCHVEAYELALRGGG